MRLLLLGLLTLASCTRCHLFVRNEYIDHTYLASCRVDTPDPLKCHSFCGQQLTIWWHFPRSYRAYSDLHIILRLRLRNFTESRVEIPVTRLWNFYVYRLLNCDYAQTGGILAYQLEVWGGGQLLETWTHQVWAELIDVSQ